GSGAGLPGELLPYVRFTDRSGQPIFVTVPRVSSEWREAGLGVNAGHDLSLDNLTPFLTGVGEVDEVSIGHALISDALERGYTETVRAYLACIPGRA
ncbi:MAG: pyridoxine 5'-phosphate synthase, partial [Limnohabitans sp.]